MEQADEGLKVEKDDNAKPSVPTSSKSKVSIDSPIDKEVYTNIRKQDVTVEEKNPDKKVETEELGTKPVEKAPNAKPSVPTSLKSKVSINSPIDKEVYTNIRKQDFTVEEKNPAKKVEMEELGTKPV